MGQFLYRVLPRRCPPAMGTAAIRGNHQPVSRRISLATHGVVPAADGVDRELGRIVVDADAHTARILRDVVDAIRNGFAEFLVAEVMHVNLVGAAFRSIVAARVLVGADQFLLLGVGRGHRLTVGLKGDDLLVDMLELSIAVGMTAAFLCLAIDLAPGMQAFEPLGDASPPQRNPPPAPPPPPLPLTPLPPPP